MHNVDDLAPVEADEGGTINVLETMPAPDPNPQESLLQKEAMAGEQQFQEQFHAFLGKERALQTLYACLCAGVSNRQDLARKLKVTPRVINNRLARLRRHARDFLRLNPSERIEKSSKKMSAQVLHLQELAKAA